MGSLLQTLLGICALREGPQDLPYAPQQLIGVIAGNAVVTYIAVANLPDTGTVVPQVAMAAIFALAFLYGLLALYGLQARFVQSATALFGTDMIINLPVAALTFPLATHGTEDAPGAATAILLLWFWQVAILGHIFRHALEIRLTWGVLLALAYSFLNIQAVQLAAG